MVQVRVERYWGQRWNGRHYEETLGVGSYYTVIECNGNSFSGCPLGRDATLEDAIADFKMRGKPEYRGTTPFEVQIVQLHDYRRCPSCKRQMVPTINGGVGCPTLGTPECMKNTES